MLCLFKRDVFGHQFVSNRPETAEMLPERTRVWVVANPNDEKLGNQGKLFSPSRDARSTITKGKASASLAGRKALKGDAPARQALLTVPSAGFSTLQVREV